MAERETRRPNAREPDDDRAGEFHDAIIDPPNARKDFNRLAPQAFTSPPGLIPGQCVGTDVGAILNTQQYQWSKLPPHPPLRPVCRNGSSPKHRARPPSARPARGLARSGGRRRPGQRRQRPFASAPLPVLRRPDDHRRDLRRPAPCEITIPEPHPDRHLMITAALPASQPLFTPPPPPAARRSRKTTPSQALQSFSRRRPLARRSHSPPQKGSPSSLPPRTILVTSSRSATSAWSVTPKSP